MVRIFARVFGVRDQPRALRHRDDVGIAGHEQRLGGLIGDAPDRGLNS